MRLGIAPQGATAEDGHVEKTDFKKTIDAYRATVGEFRIIDVPPLQYLMIDGHGDPNTAPDFVAAVEALYPVAYTLKFASRKGLKRDYVVMPLEGLWWADDHAAFTVARDKTRWKWTLMILQPDWIDATMLTDAVTAVAAKKTLRRLADVRLETLHEARCIQTLHRGAFDDETHVLARLHDEIIPSEGYRLTGRHHEIYFSDPRRGTPETRRTILRQPVASAS